MRRRKRLFRASRRRPRPAVPAAGTTSVAPRPRGRSAAGVPLSLNLLRVIVCCAVFISLVALKLLLPGGLAAMRSTLGIWLVRDADFASAFSAVGHAVSGEGGVLDSLEDAYVAVFGEEKAAEVSGNAEIEADGDASEEAGPGGEPAGETALTEEHGEEDPAAENTRGVPDHVAPGQHILGFDYAAPLAGTLTSGFGWREHPQSGRESFHYGVDLAAEEGTDIACFADGTVSVVADSVELGKYLTVHHENGVMTLYAHCSRITVSSGATVRLGDKLAEVGSTGNATGPHLHFEIHDGEEYLNPVYYLR